MDANLSMVLGVVLAGLTLPSNIYWLSERRFAPVPFAALVVSAGLILFAVLTTPDEVAFSLVPKAFINVIASLVN